MTLPLRARTVVVGALVLGTIGGAARVAVALWHSTERHRAVRTLSVALITPDSPGLEDAVRTLRRNGESKLAMRLLKEGLADARPMVRARAAHGLGCLGPEAIPLLAARLGEDDPYDRLDAIAALSLIGRETDAVMPLLIRGLEDSDEIVRLNAAGCVAVLGPRAKALIPALVKLAGEFEEVRPILREIDAEAAAKVGIP